MKYASLILLLSIVGIGGCAEQSRLTVAPARTQAVFTQAFDHAYASRGEAGAYRIVLLDDGLSLPPSAGPLKPTATPPVRQVVQIRMFWHPMLGTKPNFPSADNAVIDWYVSGIGSRASQDMIHYRGIGFVLIRPAPGGVRVTIRKGELHRVARSGQMSDPIGQAKLSGTFFAMLNESRLEQIWNRTQASASLAMSRTGLGREASVDTP